MQVQRRMGRVASSLAFVAILGASPVALAQPKLTQEQEWKGHPNLTKAVKAMDEAIKDLGRAPDDFGGNKARAESDLKQAVHSLKKAILYRLKLDDAAIDKANPP